MGADIVKGYETALTGRNLPRTTRLACQLVLFCPHPKKKPDATHRKALRDNRKE